MKKLLFVCALIVGIFFVGCTYNSPELKEGEEVQWEHDLATIREVRISGHTYIFARSTRGISICPSAETLRWVNSQSEEKNHEN